MDNNALKDKLANKAQAPAKVNDPARTVAAYLDKMQSQIAKALPKHMNADRLARIALTTIRTNPKLLECSIESLMGAVMQSAQLGLEPNMLGACYIIPYGKEAQFQIGYRGMIDLARRSGHIQSIAAHEVYENDLFKLQYGLDEKLEHIPWHLRDDQKFTEQGQIRGFYMVAKFKDGGYQTHYMSKTEIDQHRKRSKSSNNGPWVTDYVEMGKKTVVRSAWKWLPISIEVAKQVESSDETIKADIAEDMTDVPEVIVDITRTDEDSQIDQSNAAEQHE
ncbi:recombination protein RecT [Desulfosporosinus sp.]|uniref:recombination protein RecT n=1 Tax=Desulfosporosinus sp. TaxID=157907 RepID=UPI0025B8AAD5|nr:recombination protein RecT [Desulfosporosinus sp.]MBC2723509.1 recombination protein RecT [Desulfosporosinus sp.]MBC2728642.1 recombination protein RecT [Desulfosporosinus sp.]